MRYTYAQKLGSVQRLQRLFAPCPTIYSILRGKSKGGLTWYVDFYTICDNRPITLSACIATILDSQRTTEGTLVLLDSEGRNPLQVAIRDLLVRLGEFGMDTTDIQHCAL